MLIKAAFFLNTVKNSNILELSYNKKSLRLSCIYLIKNGNIMKYYYKLT